MAIYRVTYIINADSVVEADRIVIDNIESLIPDIRLIDGSNDLDLIADNMVYCQDCQNYVRDDRYNYDRDACKDCVKLVDEKGL